MTRFPHWGGTFCNKESADSDNDEDEDDDLGLRRFPLFLRRLLVNVENSLRLLSAQSCGTFDFSSNYSRKNIAAPAETPAASVHTNIVKVYKPFALSETASYAVAA